MRDAILAVFLFLIAILMVREYGAGRPILIPLGLAAAIIIFLFLVAIHS
jgi:hypothetical protein